MSATGLEFRYHLFKQNQQGVIQLRYLNLYNYCIMSLNLLKFSFGSIRFNITIGVATRFVPEIFIIPQVNIHCLLECLYLALIIQCIGS